MEKFLIIVLVLLVLAALLGLKITISYTPKEKPAKVVTPAEPSFVEGRSWHGTAFHLVALDSYDSRDALCGYDVLDLKGTLTVSEIRAALPRQHEGWHYCKACLTAAGI